MIVGAKLNHPLQVTSDSNIETAAGKAEPDWYKLSRMLPTKDPPCLLCMRLHRPKALCQVERMHDHSIRSRDLLPIYPR